MEATRIFSDNDTTDMQTHGEVEGSYAPVYAIYAGNSAAATSTTLTMDEQNDYVVDTTSKLTATRYKHRVGAALVCWRSVYTCLVTNRRHVRSDAPSITVCEDAPIHSDVVRISEMRARLCVCVRVARGAQFCGSIRTIYNR